MACGYRLRIKGMKVAFHFNADDPSLGCIYGETVNRIVFNAILQKRNLNLTSKVFVGDLLLDVCASEAVVIESDEAHMCISCHMDDNRRLKLCSHKPCHITDIAGGKHTTLPSGNGTLFIDTSEYPEKQTACGEYTASETI